MSRVVVGLDGSESSREAFREATKEAAWRGANLHAIHVVYFPASFGYETGFIDFDAVMRAGAEFLEDEVSKLVAEYDGDFPVPLTRETTMGHVGVMLAEAATEVGPDGHATELVVTGSRGLGGFKGLLLGSVANYLVHHLNTPLLIVRPEVSEDDED